MGGKAKNAGADLIKNPVKRMKSDIRGDTNFTQNQLDSIFANLGTTGRGVSRALDRSQSRTLGAMNRLAARTRNSAYAKNDQVTQHLTNRYGTAMGSAINQQMKPANAQAKATALDTVGGQQAAGLLAKGGQLGLKIEQAAAKEAQAGADYAMAAAYQDRAVALAQARLDKQNEDDAANKSQIGDAQDQIQEMAANGKTRGDAMGMVRAMVQRYNLNQKEAGKLEQFVNSLYPEGEGAYVISRLADAPVDDNNNPLQVSMDDLDKETIRKLVAGWFAGGNTLAEVLQAAHAHYINADTGMPAGTAGFFDELEAYVTRMYSTLDGGAGKKSPQSEGKVDPKTQMTGAVTAPDSAVGYSAEGLQVDTRTAKPMPANSVVPDGWAPFENYTKIAKLLTVGTPSRAPQKPPTPSLASQLVDRITVARTTMDSLVRERQQQNGGRPLTTVDIDQIMYELYQRYGVHVQRSEVVRSATSSPTTAATSRTRSGRS